MLRICDLGHHLFDDGVKVSSTGDVIAILHRHESVACKECWEKFIEQVSLAEHKIPSLVIEENIIGGFGDVEKMEQIQLKSYNELIKFIKDNDAKVVTDRNENISIKY